MNITPKQIEAMALEQVRDGIPKGWQVMPDDSTGFIEITNPKGETIHIGYYPQASTRASQMLRDLVVSLLDYRSVDANAAEVTDEMVDNAAIPDQLIAWLSARDLLPDLDDDGSFDIDQLIVALNDHENELLRSSLESNLSRTASVSDKDVERACLAYIKADDYLLAGAVDSMHVPMRAALESVASRDRKDAELFGIHMIGPDDIIAAPSKDAAERVVKNFNYYWDYHKGERVHDVHVVAEVVKWEFSAIEHAKDVINNFGDYVDLLEPFDTARQENKP
jgi:hypothetical protein